MSDKIKDIIKNAVCGNIIIVVIDSVSYEICHASLGMTQWYIELTEDACLDEPLTEISNILKSL